MNVLTSNDLWQWEEDFRKAFNSNVDPAKYWISIRRVSVSSQSWLMPKLSVHNMHSITKLNLNCPSYCYHSGIPTATRDNPLSADLDSEAWALCAFLIQNLYIWVENVRMALLTQPSDFQQLQNFNREIQLDLLFAEVQVTRTTLLKLARINIGSKFNSKFNIPILQCNEIFSQDWQYISIAYFHILFSMAMVMMTCLFSPISTSHVSHHQLSHYQSSK